MSMLIDLISKNLSQENVDNISTQIGASPAQTQSAINQVLPVLVGSLARQGRSGTSGWTLLSSFLDKNQDGSILDDLVRMALGGKSQAAGTKAVEQLLGPQQSDVTRKVAQDSGLDVSSVAKLLPLLAPMVIGALGKVQQKQGMDQRALSEFLTVEKSEAVSQSSSAGSLLAMLDENKDGSIVDDIMRKGAALFGSRPAR